MLKKYIRFTLVAIFVLALLCGIAMAETIASGSCGTSSKWALDSEGTLTISGSGKIDHVPSDQVPWVNYLADIKTVKIGSKITQIGSYAFHDCVNLTSVSIPDSVTSIGVVAFQNCSSLKSISLPSKITTLRNMTFQGCTSLESIVIPDSVTTIEVFVFKGCTGLKSVALSNNLESMDMGVFGDCTSLESISLPDSLTTIGDEAFSHCTSLKSIEIPDSVSNFGLYMFTGCSSLESVSLPSNLTSIGDGTFHWCSNLKSVDIPESVTCIGYSAFMNCTKLKTVEIPDAVTSIGEDAFNACALESVVLPDGLTTIERNTFSGCKFTNIVIPEGVTTIGNSAFSACKKLSSIVLPEGLKSIGSFAFGSCENLSSICFPNSLETIGDYAFNWCDQLTTVILPDSLTSIGAKAFQYCWDLSGITIPAGITSIGEETFNGCSSLKQMVFLGNKLPELGTNLFDYSVPTIYCYEAAAEIALWADAMGYTVEYLDGMDTSAPWSMQLPADCSLLLGESRYAPASHFPWMGEDSVEYASSAPEIVSVAQDGMITAHAVGKATITATCGSLSDSMVVSTYVKPESFELSQNEIWLLSKETVQLSVQNIQPSDATTSFNWTSGNTNYASVNSSGLVTAKAAGDTVITVVSDNGIVRECIVHVCYAVSSVEFDPAQESMAAGRKLRLNAKVTTGDHTLFNKLLSFSSSDETIATVDETGLVTALAVGEVTITATASNGIAAECLLTITESFRLPDNMQIIKTGAFEGISAADVVLPEGCTEIGSRAFASCKNLRSVNIPDSVSKIADDAFSGSENVVLICESDNLGAAFARANGIDYRLSN